MHTCMLYSIIAACYEAANATIPLTSCRQASSRIPGWTEHVKPVIDKSIFWHNLWMDCGRPRAGVLVSLCVAHVLRITKLFVGLRKMNISFGNV